MKDFRIKRPFVCHCTVKPHGGALSTQGLKGEDMVESLGMSLHQL